MKNLVLTQKMLTPIKQSLIDGLTVASGAKSNATYYHSKDEQMKAIQSQIKGMYNLSKELPLIIASQKGATGRFISEVLLNEFKNTSKGGACNIVNPIDWYDNGISDKALLCALNNLGENGLPYVLRLFIDLKESKVNNERARKITLGYIWGQENLEFYSMKYRNKIANILKHVYGQKMTSIITSIAKKQVNGSSIGFIGTEKELNIAKEFILKYFNGDAKRAFMIFLFIFKKEDDLRYNATEFPLLYEYQLAKTDIREIKRVPEEVLLGLISSSKHPQYDLMWANKQQRDVTKALIRKNTEVTSTNQQVRQTKSNEKMGVVKPIDLEKATDFMALYKTGFETSFTPELKIAINKLAEKKKIQGFYYDNIGVVLDKSASMKGHKAESKNTPLAIAFFTSKVLEVSAKSSVWVYTGEDNTDIASAFINVLKQENPEKPYNAIFIITDGYENTYDGLTNEVINIWKAESQRDIPIFQLSPVTGAEVGANVRKLGQGVVTMSINNPSAIMPQINARLLEIDTAMWLENQVKLLESTEISRNKKIIVNV